MTRALRVVMIGGETRMSGHTMLGDYALHEPLPWGTAVEHVQARKAGSPVSLRLLRAADGRDPAAVEAFVARGRAALRFRHPNLVRATQVGRAQGRFYVATDPVRGQTLAALLDRCRRTGQRLSLGQVVSIAEAICLGLEHAHAHVRPCRPHPGDVVVGYDGVVRVLVCEPSSGVPAYIAPEQVRGQGSDQAADQFVVAAMIFEMLTLDPAFSGENEFQSLEKVRRAEIAPASLWNDRIPNEMDEIVKRASARDPVQRFADAGAMAQALADLRKGFALGAVDLAELVRRTFPDEARADEAARRVADQSSAESDAIKDKVMRAPRALGLEPIYWVGIAVMVAGAAWLAAGR